MIELPLIFVAGTFGSAHCIGMCGPIALAISGGARNTKDGLRLQMAYTAGRVATYTILGAIAGYAGWRLAAVLPSLYIIPAALSVLAGCVLAYQGLVALGIIRRRTKLGSPCLAAGLFAPLLQQRRFGASFLAGVATAFLPCGLIYATLAMAAASRDMRNGAAIMLVFAVGTAPLMIALGSSASLLVGLNRARLYRFANWCLIIAGTLCIVRGAGSLSGDAVARPADRATVDGDPKSDSIFAAPWCR